LALDRGEHVIQARYRCNDVRAAPSPPPLRSAGIGHFLPFPKPVYKARSSSILDKETRGSWIGKYGKHGYVLFGFDSDNETRDRVKLPPFVSSVSLTQHGFRGTIQMPRVHVGYSTTNASFLQDPANPSGPRSLGFPSTIGMGQGFLLAINWTMGVPLNVSVYAVGTDASSAQAIRPMDLRSFSPVAPEPYFSDFKEGGWWTISYTPPVQQTGAYSGDKNNGLCLRVMNIYGMTISAVAFD
jgi:hypothetical protein